MQALPQDVNRCELRLYQRLSQRFPLCKEICTIAGQARYLYSIADPDSVLKQTMLDQQLLATAAATSLGTGTHIKALDMPAVEPYWAQHWKAAFAMEAQLDDILHQLPHIHSKSKIIELGCGGGLLSLGLRLRGYQVTATDIAHNALLLTKLNGIANRTTIAVRKLDWAHCEPWPTDLIVAADIAYDRSAFGAIDTCLKKLLHNEGQAIIAEPYRSLGDEFIDFLLCNNWHVRIQDGSRRSVSDTDQTASRVRFIHLKRPSTRGS